jgi:3-isopropylmalate/(R)-2-methylmalate dehydratase small subunit
MAITKTDKEWIVEGTVWKAGNNVNTESITPSHWLHSGEGPMLEHIAEMLFPEFPKKMQKGDILAAGSNLGCSSSRNAPLFLRKKGVGAVICHSAARIFYRNALNSGLPVFEIGEDISKINMGDRLRVDVNKALIENLTAGLTIRAKPLPDFIMALLTAGGINEYIVSRKGEYKLLK